MTNLKSYDPRNGNDGDWRAAAKALNESDRVFLRVAGASMAPALLPGDLLKVRRAGPIAPAVGDIVVFPHAGRLVSHRVVRCDPHCLIARGDAAAGDDPPVAVEGLTGVVELVLRNGRVFAPRRRLTPLQRAVAALIRRSTIANRALQRAYAARVARTSPLGAFS